MRSSIRIIYLLILFISIAFNVSGQNSKTADSIFVSHYSLDKKASILFQSDSFIALTSTKYLWHFLSQAKDTSSFKWERNLFTNCSSDKSDTANLYTCAKLKSLEHLVVNLIPELVEKKACVILRRGPDKVVTKLLVKPYKRFDVAGAAYYIDGKLLFETIETVY
jgi:hypothetical protein